MQLGDTSLCIAEKSVQELQIPESLVTLITRCHDPADVTGTVPGTSPGEFVSTGWHNIAKGYLDVVEES
jgi:hypothetical protein